MSPGEIALGSVHKTTDKNTARSPGRDLREMRTSEAQAGLLVLVSRSMTAPTFIVYIFENGNLTARSEEAFANAVRNVIEWPRNLDVNSY